MNPKLSYWLLIVGFAVMASLPFLVPGLGVLALVSFVPLFMLERQLQENDVRRPFWYWYAAFLLFNIATTWWIWNVSEAGAIAAIALNALQMAAVFSLYHWAGRVIRRVEKRPMAAGFEALVFFIVAWLAWEHVYFNVEFSWPWLCLGNAFATTTRLVQWYEITGALGGSAWILLTSTLVYLTLESRTKGARRGFTIATAVLLLVPMLASEYRYASYRETEDPMEVVVVQPNVDPFQKYGIQPQSAYDQRLVELMEEAVTPDTRYIITPETFTYNLILDSPEEHASIRVYQDFLGRHPDTRMLLGALTNRYWREGAKPTRSARHIKGGWVDLYNTALVLDSEHILGWYYKSKLVPGVEIIPYENVLTFLGPIMEEFGGSSNSYGTQEEMDSIEAGDGRKVGAMICYESVFGDWSRVATKKGADFLAVMTNDGWWGDTPGYRQHFDFARLRAIENRRDVIQAANTGISGVINQRGDVLCRSSWWVETTLRETINGNKALTHFARHGDFVGRSACYSFVILLISLLIWKGVSASDKRSGRGRSASGRS